MLKAKHRGKLKSWWAITVFMLIVVIIAGCSSSNSNDSAANKASSDSDSGYSEMLSNKSYAEGEMAAVDQYGDAIDSKANVVATTSGANSSSSGQSSPGQPATAPSIGAPGNSALSTLDRKLIYRANVTMEVADYGTAQTELFNLVSLSGGYMLNFSDNRTSYEVGGVFVMKVPALGFQSFLTGLEELKKDDTFQRNVQGQDVTEEFVDLSSRLKAKQVVEARLLGFMAEATDTSDLLEFSNELARVQEEIEAMKGRMRFIDQNVSFSTIELRMYQVLKPKEKADDPNRNVITRAGSALKGSAEAVLIFVEGLLIVLAGSVPILLLLAIILVPSWLIYRKTRYRNKIKEKSITQRSILEQKPKDDDTI